LPPRGHRAHNLALAILLAAPFVFGWLALFLGQDANWDLRNYHWYNAFAFLNNRYSLDLLPAQTPSFYNPLLDVPFYLLATHFPAKVAGFCLGAVQGLNFILLFMLAHMALIVPNLRQKVIVCALLALLGMLGGGGIAMLGTTFYDNVTSLGLFLSALLIVRNLNALMRSDGAHSFRSAVLFGLPAGMMMGLKLPSVIFCVGLCFALLCIRGHFQRRVLISFAFGVGVLIGIAITMGYWASFLQNNYGNPLFPYFNQYFQSPLAPLSSARDLQYITRNLHDFIFFPFIFADSPFRVGEIPWRDWRIPILYALLPIAILLRLFFGRSKDSQQAIAEPLIARYLLWVTALSYFVWVGMFCIYRYAVPMEMLAPLLIVCAVGMLPLKLQTRGILAALILVVIAVTIQPGNWYRRATWNSHFVEATLPDLGDTSNAMLLMAGFEPYSHMVTQFPPNMPVVRIQSNFASPNEDKGINKLIHTRIDQHKGRFLMLMPPWQIGLADEALGYFNLRIGKAACQTVIDRLYDDKELALCPVEHK